MTAAKPAPLTPPDSDLRGMEWMPLYGHRLFGSDFDINANDAEFRAGLGLWWSAWNQVPAASLPNDETALARFAGCGRDAKAWKRVRTKALHAFVECSDGRLYHKALAPFAVESWNRRLKDRERKARLREKAREQQDGARTGAGTERSRDADGTRNVHGTGRGQGAETGRDRTADEMRRDETLREDSPPPPSPHAASAGPEWARWGVAIKSLMREFWPNDQRVEMAQTGICAGWLADGFDLELDVLPAIRVVCEGAAKRGQAPNGLSYFVEAIKRRRADRLAGLPAPQPRNPADRGSGPLPADPWDARLANHRAQLDAGKPIRETSWHDRALHWGPMPGERGCMAPADLIAKHGPWPKKDAA